MVLIGLLEIKDNEIGVTMPRLFDEFFTDKFIYILCSLLGIASSVISQISLCAWEVAGIEPMNVTVDVN
jgi:hypothetical protein